MLYDISYKYPMPHISKSKVSKEILTQLDNLLADFLAHPNVKKRENIFREVLTPTERAMLGKRLALLYFINKNVPTHTISEILRMSPSTVARFELKSSIGRYKATIKWLTREKNPLVRFLDHWLSLTYSRPSLSKILDEE